MLFNPSEGCKVISGNLEVPSRNMVVPASAQWKGIISPFVSKHPHQIPLHALQLYEMENIYMIS